jgi:hypothetical protein
LSDVDDESDDHYDFLRRLNKQEKEESDIEQDDTDFIVEDDGMMDIDRNDAGSREASSKSKKSNRKSAKSRPKRKGSISSDDGEPNRKKTKATSSKKNRMALQQSAPGANDENAMELDIEQTMAELFDSESEYEDKLSRPKPTKAVRKPKGAAKNLTNGIKNKKKANGLKIEDDDAMDGSQSLLAQRSNAADSPSTKTEAVVPSVVKTEHHIAQETSEEESSEVDDYSDVDTIATDEFSDLESDVGTTALTNGVDDWHPLKQVHDAEDRKFMQLAMQGYQNFDETGPSEATHVVRSTGKHFFI